MYSLEYKASKSMTMVRIIPILSVCLALLLGIKSIIIVLLLGFLFFTIRYKDFLIHFYLSTLPLVILLIPEIASIYTYSMILIIIFSWVIRKILLDNERIRYSKSLIIFIIVFMFVALVSSLNKGINQYEINPLVKFPIFFLFICLLYDTYDPKDTFKYFVSMTIPLFISCCVLISTFVNARNWFELLNLYRLKPAGIFDNANAFGGALICVIPYWAALLIWVGKKHMRVLSSLVFLILFISLVFTNSRASFVGILLSTVLFAIWMKKVKYFIAVCLSTIILLFSIPSARILVSAALRVERGASMRGEIWGNTVEMIKEDFWLGIGIGNFTHDYIPYFETVWLRNFAFPFSNPHNLLLRNFVEMGILGLVLILVLYYWPPKTGILLLRRLSSREDRGVVYGIIAGIIALYGRSIFEGGGIASAGQIYPDILFWILFIMLLKTNDTENLRFDKVF